MALAVVVDGQTVEVREPRVSRMIIALIRRQQKISAIAQGDVQIHFGGPERTLDVRVAEADKE